MADIFSEILAPKNMVREKSKKMGFREPLDRQQGKWVNTVLQSEWQHSGISINHCEGSCIAKSLF